VKQSNYWSRRQVLRGAGIGLAGLAGAALLGCGDSEEATGGTATVAPVDFTATPPAPGETVKTGGTWKAFINGDPPNLDSFTNSSLVTRGVGLYSYNRVMQIPAEAGKNPFDVSPSGDLAESVETADGLTWIVNLKKGVKMQNVAPLNGREVTAEDVAHSFRRLKGPTSLFASAVSHVDSVEVVDTHTLRFNHSAPNADFLDLMADGAVWVVMPVESDPDNGSFNPNEQLIGAGPWIFEDYEVGSVFKFRRNPDWHGAPLPYMDRVELYVIPEYTNQLAQFQAGALHTMVIQPADVVDLRKAQPDVQWYTGTAAGMWGIYFAPVETSPNALWQDDRFRRGMSMSINRGEFQKFLYRHDELTAAGLPVVTRWNNLVSNGLGDRWWLDPQSADQGPSAQYFNYDPAEARKMLDAVGAVDQDPIKFQYTDRYGAAFVAGMQALHGYFQEVGLNTTLEVQDYSSVYVSQTWQGRLDGFSVGAYGGFTSLSGYLSEMIGNNPANLRLLHTPDILDLLDRQARELDLEARVDLVHELQRVNADHMYIIPTTGSGQASYNAYRPEVRGGLRLTRGQGTAAEITPHYWLDE